ncbi:MAG: hypothetical protein Alpg2KO_21400 [Alphaproteobacteria bacterium]
MTYISRPLTALLFCAFFIATVQPAEAQSRRTTFNCAEGVAKQAEAQRSYEQALQNYNANQAKVEAFKQQFDTALLQTTRNGMVHLSEEQGKPYDEQWSRIRKMQEIMQGERKKVMGFGNAACEATKVFTESNGAGRSCYSVRSRYTQTVNEMCGTTYQLQLNADGEIPLPASWRELFRYQR